ncbi:hydrogenase maturation nickel metallochaperone HypA [Niveibacterium sp.]|uniref:hydrogenase maturation nickel metallochaperone HypA n=2 Tax=Niveibacterium sp. TaxID=2017444 RepID=UPI0035AFD23A
MLENAPMHELSLAERVIGIVEGAARKAGARRVTRIALEIGALAHVEAETLQYCCEVVSRGTLAETASIEVQRRPGRAWCETCAAEVELEQIGMPCPDCAGFRLKVTDGDQMRVVDVVIEPGEPA